ncbi:hypothetical protein H6A16_03070 [Collinsella tanakaei]|uniref:hypothetical protein n=1 Tax=Collinsella tanakaei TaxID=626935 RepID=UPI001958AAE9|nr:hypothetical protein [Collinsella tanakaei]MBM6778479.1 hypothetical protein [Collinsella tanakaei]
MAAQVDIKQALAALKEHPEVLEGIASMDAAALVDAAGSLGIELDSGVAGKIVELVQQASGGAAGEIDDNALAGVTGGIAWGEVIDKFLDEML